MSRQNHPPYNGTKKHRSDRVLIRVSLATAATMVLVVGIVAFVFTRSDSSSGPEGAAPRSTSKAANERKGVSGLGAHQVAADAQRTIINVSRRETVVPDDGQTLWASPTAGEPIRIRYMPPGSQVFLVVRLADLLRDSDSQTLLAAFDSAGSRYLESLEQMAGIAPSEIEQLILGFRAERGGRLVAVGVIRLKAALDAADVSERWANWASAKRQGETYFLSGGRTVYLPAAAHGSVVVFGPVAAIEEAIAAGEAAPPLRREMEALLADSDASRHVTILFAPSFLLSDGKTLLSGAAAEIRKPIGWFFGDHAKAALLSVHFGESFFVELRVAGTPDVEGATLSSRLRDRLHEVPRRVEAYVVSLDPQPYGRLLLHRFPQMVQLMDRFTREAAEHRQAVLRCYLPGAAGYNLLFGLDLVLAERGVAGSVPIAAKETSVQTAREKLRQPITLRFDQDTLESALQMIASATGVNITIAGRDLQLDGITKNQSFGIDVTDEPAEEVLLHIMRLANPDKSAQSATDPAQKLVYVIRTTEPNGEERVVVTTRDQARKRGERLPRAFMTGEIRGESQELGE